MKKFLPATFFVVFFFFCFPVISLFCQFVNTPVYAYSDQVYFIHQDRLGSVVAVSDEEGNVVSETKYEAYGDAPSGSSLYSVGDDLLVVPQNGQTGRFVPTEKGYTGQIKDQNTALQYYSARYYDPVISRFVSADSAGGGNRFAYVGGNPVMASDPSGNWECAYGDSSECGNPNNAPYGWVGWDPKAENFATFAANSGMGKETWDKSVWAQGALFLGGAIAGPEIIAGAGELYAAGPAIASYATAYAPAWAPEALALGGVVNQIYGLIACGSGNQDACFGYFASIQINQMQQIAEQAILSEIPVSEVQYIVPSPRNGGYVTRNYTSSYRAPASFKLYRWEKKALEFARNGDFEGAWSCVSGTCSRYGATVIYDGKMDAMGMGGQFSPAAKTIYLSPYHGNKWDLLSSFGHEVNHMDDYNWWNRLGNWGARTVEGSVPASEARSQYFQSFLEAALGNAQRSKMHYDNAMRFAFGFYPQ